MKLQISENLGPENKPAKESGPVYRTEISAEEKSQEALPVEKRIFLASLEIEEVKNSFGPAERLEQFDPSNLRHFFCINYDKIDEEMLRPLERALLKEKAQNQENLSENDLAAISEFKEKLVEKLIWEAGGKSTNGSIEARFKKSLNPKTSILEKICLAKDAEILADSAKLITRGKAQVRDEVLEATNEGAEDELKSLDNEIGKKLKAELITSLREKQERKNDETIEQAKEELANTNRHRHLIKHLLVNLGPDQEELRAKLLSDFQKRAALETYLPLREKEKEKADQEIAELKALVLEAIYEIDLFDNKNAFKYCQKEIEIEKAIELAEREQYDKYLAKSLERPKTEGHKGIIKNHEAELSQEEKARLAQELKSAFQSEVEKKTDNKLTEDEKGETWKKFFDETKEFWQVLGHNFEQTELINQFEKESTKFSSIGELAKCPKVLEELLQEEILKDQSYDRLHAERAYHRCQYVLDKLANRPDLKPDERELYRKEAEKIRFQPERQEVTLVHEEALKKSEKITHESEELKNLRLESVRLEAEFARLDFSLELAEAVRENLIRKFNLHKASKK